MTTAFSENYVPGAQQLVPGEAAQVHQNPYEVEKKCVHCGAVIYLGMGGHWYNDERDGRDSQAWCAWSSGNPDMPLHEPAEEESSIL